jgi:hypothetical protein
MLDYRAIGEAANEAASDAIAAGLNSPDGIDQDKKHYAMGRAAVGAMIPVTGPDGFCGDCPFKHWDEIDCHCTAGLAENLTVGCRPGRSCPASGRGEKEGKGNED